MSLPPLQLRSISTSHYYTSGDVMIHDGAAIAPGVLIQADPESRIIIRSGACIGIGAILHAQRGIVEIGEGASIGAEVLLVGQVTIGANACVGTASTILNTTIAPGQIVPPGSLIGDTSRPAETLQATDTVLLPKPDPTLGTEVGTSQPAKPEPEAVSTPVSEEASQAALTHPGMNVYGQVYVNQLLVKMFPNSRQSSMPASPPLDSAATSEDPWNS